MTKKLIQAICISAAMTLTAHAADLQKLNARVEAAHEVLHELMLTPDRGIPDSIASKATCVAVIPGFKRAPSSLAGNTGKGL